MSKPRITHFLAVIAVTLCISAPSHAGGIEDQMGAMFGNMTNFVAPTSIIDGTKRGVISGGGLYVKNRISKPNLISFVPPSFEAGCGGINMFGGSFSFISAAQLQQLLRDIASSAASYAFSLALSAMCGDCLNQMQELAHKIQAMNEMLGNSCQLGKGLVTKTLEAIRDKDQKSDATLGIASGIGEAFEMFRSHNATNPTEEVQNSGLADDCKYNSNLLWCSMKRKGSLSWFVAGDNRLLETIMSYTGSYVVGPLEMSADGKGKQPKLTPVPPTSISLKDLIEGGEVRLNVCTDGHGQNQCLSVNQIDYNLVGMKSRVEDLLSSIILKLSTNSGTLTVQERNFIVNAPGGVGAMIRNLSVLQPGSAEMFAVEAGPYVALDMVYYIIQDILTTARSVQDDATSSFVVELQEMLVNAKREISLEKIELRRNYLSQSELYEYYTNLIQTVRHKRYGLQLGIASSANTQ